MPRTDSCRIPGTLFGTFCCSHVSKVLKYIYKLESEHSFRTPVYLRLYQYSIQCFVFVLEFTPATNIISKVWMRSGFSKLPSRQFGSDWGILLGMVEARSVNVKKTTTNNNNMLRRSRCVQIFFYQTL